MFDDRYDNEEKLSFWDKIFSSVSSGFDSWTKSKSEQNKANASASMWSGIIKLATYVAGGLFVLSLFKKR